jgi:rhamnogalacturonyl hydrolase YesR
MRGGLDPYGCPDVEAIQMMRYIFEMELDIVRRIAAQVEQLKERWDMKDGVKVMQFLCRKSTTKTNEYIVRLLRSVGLELDKDQLISLLRRLD